MKHLQEFLEAASKINTELDQLVERFLYDDGSNENFIDRKYDKNGDYISNQDYSYEEEKQRTQRYNKLTEIQSDLYNFIKETTVQNGENSGKYLKESLLYHEEPIFESCENETCENYVDLYDLSRETAKTQYELSLSKNSCCQKTASFLKKNPIDVFDE